MPVVTELRDAIKDAERKAIEAKEQAGEAKAEISAHERECALRYAGISTELSDIKTALASDRRAIAAERIRFGKFVWSVVGAIALLTASLVGWLLFQLYTLEPLRVQAVEQRGLPAAASTK